MAIPKILRADVLAAIARIDREGVPDERQSTRYALVQGNRRYPPKYVVSLAVEHSLGRPLDPQLFGGGTETNSVLRHLGFSVVTVVRDAADPEANPAGSHQNDRDESQAATRIGRLVVIGQQGDLAVGERLLREVLTRRWPKGLHVKFLVTPGGFAVAPFPSLFNGETGWSSQPAALASLRPHAEVALARILSDRVRQAATGRVEVITVGIDLIGDDRPEHAELVAIYDVGKQTVSWTGKSYPTDDQENSLVQVVDLDTHFLQVAGERVVVLGCHDLNMFNPRGWANQDPDSVRHLRCADMRKRTKAFRPTVILQHPHSTDTPNIWRNAWGEIANELPDVTAWASGIAYHRWGEEPRAPIERVLGETQGGEPCVDFLVDAK